MIFSKTFIKKFPKDDSPLGDLAQDLASDHDFSRKNDYDTILDYLYSKNTIPNVISTFDIAWGDYIAS